MTTSYSSDRYSRLLVYAAILVFLAALLYREATLGRPMLSAPVTFVCLAGASHVLCGVAWRQTATRRFWLWSTWLFMLVGLIASIRLMVPI